MIEEWRDIKGYEGFYQVSNLGNVRSIFADEHYRAKILKPHEQPNGYVFVNLWKDKKPKHKTIHRLVAEAFIPNPNNYPCVNHKDENKQNNRVDNLEFCTHSYNMNYGKRAEKCLATRKSRGGFTAEKTVLKCNTDGNIVEEWKYLMEAKRNGYSRRMIQFCFTNPNKTYCGCRWCPKDKYDEYIKHWILIDNPDYKEDKE